METSRVEARETIDKRLEDAEMRAKLQRGVKVEPKPFVLDASTMARMGIKMPKPAAPTTPQGGVE
jgi:hypothetical protein